MTEDDSLISLIPGMPQRKFKRGLAPKSPAPGLSVKRMDNGRLTVRRNRAKRASRCVTIKEIEALARQLGCRPFELLKLFDEQKYTIRR